MRDPTDPRLRFRIYIAGRLVEECWLDVLNPDRNEIVDRMRDRHEQMVQVAEREGKLWMIETFDPAEPEEQAYHRVGTDTGGMVDPRRPL